MFFDFMLDVRSHDPHGERTDGGFIFQIDTIQAPDPIEDIEIDSFEDPPNTPTIETCNLTAMGTLFGSLCVDELLQDPESVDDDGAELQNPENLDDDGAEIFPLDNGVLPLLAENQFPGLRWDVLRPVMQVASKLLESPASQEYLYAVFISRLRDIPCADQPSRTYRSIFRKETLLTAKERKVVKRRLQQMAAYVTFSISDIEGKDVQGYCQAQATKVRGISGCSGVASHIVLNRKCYKQYCDHFDRTSADSAQEHKDRVQRLAFRMVTTLCHELAHAFCHARFSPKSRGLGFENQCISEEGFDWESCVFGGMVSSSANCAAVTDWPCASRFDVYSRAGNPISVARVPEHDVSIDWKVPATYVRSIFQPSTWEQPAPDLKVPKLLGYRNIPCASRGVCQCYDCQKTALLTAARIERGTGKLDYEKLSKDTITVMRTLKQTTPPCPRILRKMRAAAKTNAENNNVAPDGADASSPPTNNDSTQALDYDFWCEDPRDPSNEGDQFDEDLDQYEPYLYGDCHREAWGHYPYGPLGPARPRYLPLAQPCHLRRPGGLRRPA